MAHGLLRYVGWVKTIHMRMDPTLPRMKIKPKPNCEIVLFKKLIREIADASLLIVVLFIMQSEI